MPVLGMAGSAFFDEADRRGLRTVAEVFADRAYQPNGTLVPAGNPVRCLMTRRSSRTGW